MAVRIGKIGIGHAHAVGWTNALRESLEVEFVGIFEPHPETIAVRSQDPAYGGVRWLSEDELPGDRSVQAVFVETRPADNLGWARRALEAGKHISIDMAPSRSLNQLQEEFDLARLRRMHVNMGYMFRFNPAFQFAFEAVESGLLGEVFRVEAEIPTNYRGHRCVQRRAEMERYPGGVMYELGCHFVDLGIRPRYVGDVAEFVEVVSGKQPPRYSSGHELAAHQALLQACGASE